MRRFPVLVVFSVGCTDLRFRQNWILSPSLSTTLCNNINFLELVTSCLAITLFASYLRSCMLIVKSDYTSTVAFSNRGYTRNPEAIKWLKLIFGQFCTYDFRVSRINCQVSRTKLHTACAGLLSRLAMAKSFCHDFPIFALTNGCLPDLSYSSYLNAKFKGHWGNCANPR